MRQERGEVTRSTLMNGMKKKKTQATPCSDVVIIITKNSFYICCLLSIFLSTKYKLSHL